MLIRIRAGLNDWDKNTTKAADKDIIETANKNIIKIANKDIIGVADKNKLIAAANKDKQTITTRVD